MKTILFFTCECMLQRNGVQVQFNKPSAVTKTLFLKTALQQGDSSFAINDAPNQFPIIEILNGSNNNMNDVFFQIQVSQIKQINMQFIKEGKITLQIDESSHWSDKTVNSLGIVESKILFVFLNKSTKEILIEFVDKLKAIIQSQKSLQKCEQRPQNNQISTQSKSNDQHGRNAQLLYKQTRPMNMPAILPSNPPVNRFRKQLILNSTTKEQQENKDMHPFLKRMKQNSENGHQQQSNENKVQPLLFERLPINILMQIMQYLPQTMVKSLNFLNKDFNNLMWRLQQCLDLTHSYQQDFPPSILKSILSRTFNLKTLKLGKFKQISPTFLTNCLDISACKNSLRELDFSQLSILNDKIVQKFVVQCKGLEKLKLPYYSKMTDQLLVTIGKFQIATLKSLQVIAPQINYSQFAKNQNLTDTAFINLFRLNQNQIFNKFALHITSPIFYNKVNDDSLKIMLSLRVLKLTNIIFQKPEDQQCLQVLKNFKNLTKLSIQNIIYPNEKTYLHEKVELDGELLKDILQSLLELAKVDFGEFSNDLTMNMLARFASGKLEKIRIKSSQVTDLGLGQVLSSCLLLKNIDISGCLRVDGSAFLELPQQSEELQLIYQQQTTQNQNQNQQQQSLLSQITVSLEAYYVQCLVQILKQKKLMNATITRVT